MIGRRAAREAAEEDLLEGILREALCISFTSNFKT